jgi:murein hydrolase activator
MTLFRCLGALSLTALVASAQLGMAEEPRPEDLQAVEQDLVISTGRQAELLAETKAALDEQDKLSDQLVALAATATAQERQLGTVEKRQTKLKDEIAKISLNLAAQQDVMAEVLAGLQRLSQNPPPALVVAPNDVLGALRGAMLFGTIVPEMRGAAQKLHDQLTELKTLRERLDTEAREHDETLQALTTSRGDINALIAEKKALAVTSEQALNAERKHAEDLAAKATSLKQLLATLATEKAEEDAKLTAEAKAREALEQQLKAASLIPQVAFSKSKGLITYPAQGDIIRQFGEVSPLGDTLSGLIIATAKQAQVVSPVTGKIEFAGKFRSYGQMVIVNPGEGYLVLLAGLDHVNTAHGQSVKAGEPLGVMGSKAGSVAMSNGLADLTTPVLYVEFRKNGDPVDPTPWWIGNRQEAMR